MKYIYVPASFHVVPYEASGRQACSRHKNNTDSSLRPNDLPHWIEHTASKLSLSKVEGLILP